MSDQVSPGISAHRLDPAAYRKNFADVHAPLSTNEAKLAAEHCLFCYNAPCIEACPTGIDIPQFIRQIGGNDPLSAAKTIFDANIMGGMCARVCPTDTLCEGACVRNADAGEAVKIGLLQRYATDAAMAQAHHPYKRGVSSGRRVAVVGAGPAGLACAHGLARDGHDVTIFEARPKGGGLNEYGIAAYKAVDDFAARELDFILQIGGIAVKYGHKLGDNVMLAELVANFDAVFLGLGLAGTNALGLPGALPQGVMDAVAFIETLRQTADKSSLGVGRNIVVIGGGMTAIDIARQTRRLGASDVTICYRRGPEAMKASLSEQEGARADGVFIRHHLTPLRLVAEGGQLRAVELAIKTPDADIASAETISLPCDQLFLAIGQTWSDGIDMPLAMKDGRIAVDAARRTSQPKIWAGGDCIADGLDLTVAAVEDGKLAAVSISQTLAANPQERDRRG